MNGGKNKMPYYEGDIDHFKVGNKVTYPGHIAPTFKIVENTGERIDLQNLETDQVISVFHYNAHRIKLIDEHKHK